jgi:Protein of unknown function (DUF2550)
MPVRLESDRNDEMALLKSLSTAGWNGSEVLALNAGEKVLRLEMQDGHSEAEWELAMSQDSLTGLLSWLEAAPPGVRRFE